MKIYKIILIVIFSLLISSCGNNDNEQSSQSNILGVWDLKTIDGETDYYVDGWGNAGFFQFIFNNQDYILRFISSNEQEDLVGTWSVNSSETELTTSNSVNSNEIYEIILLTETDMILHKTSSEFVFEKAN